MAGAALTAGAWVGATADAQVRVGPAAGGGYVVPTRQVIRAAGQDLEYGGRPVDLAVSPDGRRAYVKSNDSLLVIDTRTWKVAQELKAPAGGTLHGIAVAADGRRVYVTGIKSTLMQAVVGDDGRVTWDRQITLRSKAREGDSYPCGIALAPDGRRAWVCLSMANTLAEVDLADGTVLRETPVGVAPYDVVLADGGRTAWVSNWGGRRPVKGDRTGKSAGTETVVDERGVASTGTLSAVDLGAAKELVQVDVGLHPADLVLSPDGRRLYIANANSDTVSVVDAGARRVIETIPVRPDDKLPFGSAPNALALSDDGTTLYVANGGNNAVAVVRLSADGSSKPATPAGFIPAGWWPGALAVHGSFLYVANVKGVGSRNPGAEGQWSSYSYWGTVNKVPLPGPAELGPYTAQVRANALVPQSLRAWEMAQSGVSPVPIPAHVGEPSPIEHVVYVIKENRTYDQLLGDVKTGNGDPKLCIFGKNVTPNHHALAEQFVLLDNFYCNGVLSADGHAWATEGYAVDYFEKSFGGWARSYPFPDDDPLAAAPTGYIWDNARAHGVTFRNYGEFVTTATSSTLLDVYRDYVAKAGKAQIKNKIELAALVPYSCADSPGWDLTVPDQVRADVFLRELAEAEQRGTWPNLMILYLPQDHTNGTSPGTPTPGAMVADNDLALGRVVEAVSHSRFWPKTAIFVIEDDPQNGFDHVDGHRSICLVASPYTKRRATVSAFYNQTSVLHTIELILGLHPMNQMDAMAPAMHEAFTDTPDPAPYTAVKNNVPLDQLNPTKAALSGRQLEMARLSERQDFRSPDKANENDLNRIIWFAQMGWDSRYPKEWAGPHGRGLKALRLRLGAPVKDDDDDD